MNLSQEFYEKIRLFDDFTYLYYYLKLHLAPTRYCQKIGGLLNLSYTIKPLHKIFMARRYDYEKKLQLKSYLLKENDQQVLVYFYEPNRLKAYLQRKDCQDFLKFYGYRDPSNVDACLDLLRTRFQRSCPHEVGLFLGYPLSDVQAFSSYGGQACPFKGYWCVYSNVDSAKELFLKYDQKKEQIMHRVLLGQG